MTADASRTTLVTLDLRAALGINLIREEDPARDVTSKLFLHLGKKLFTRFDMQPVVVFNNDDRVASADVAALASFRGKRDAARGIHFEVIDLLLVWHGRFPVSGSWGWLAYLGRLSYFGQGER